MSQRFPSFLLPSIYPFACVCVCVCGVFFFRIAVCAFPLFLQVCAIMRPAFKMALFIAIGLALLIGIGVVFGLQFREQQRQIDAIRAEQLRAINPRKVRQMIEEATRRPPSQPHYGSVNNAGGF
jgi:hypothetical protein